MAGEAEAKRLGERQQINAILLTRLKAIEHVVNLYGITDPNNGIKALQVGRYTASIHPKRLHTDSESPQVLIYESFSDVPDSDDLPPVVELFYNFSNTPQVNGAIIVEAVNYTTHAVEKPSKYLVKDVRKNKHTHLYGNPATFHNSPASRIKQMLERAQDGILSWSEEAVKEFTAYEEQRKIAEADAAKAEEEALLRQQKEKQVQTVAGLITSIAVALQESDSQSMLPRLLNTIVMETNPGANNSTITLDPSSGFAQDAREFSEVDICEYHEGSRSVIVRYNRKNGKVTYSHYRSSDSVESYTKPIAALTTEETVTIQTFLESTLAKINMMSRPKTNAQSSTQAKRRGRPPKK